MSFQCKKITKYKQRSKVEILTFSHLGKGSEILIDRIQDDINETARVGEVHSLGIAYTDRKRRLNTEKGGGFAE